ncbi:MAG TPA: hypothetical protein VHA15_14865 [Burkholderiales bacterium]|jgi:hypothetical protein|nr:hypothetical protein [Burkholderiales bacterium]
MTMRSLLLLCAAVLAASPAIAADAPKRIAERVPAADPAAAPMPAASPREALAAPPARKGKRVRHSFPAPRRVM